MGYFKDSRNIYVKSGRNYSAEGTPSEMKKRGVIKGETEPQKNLVTKLELVNHYRTSGQVEYGMEVELECTLISGDIVIVEMDAQKYLNWLYEFTSVNGVIKGEFIILFKGVIYELAILNGERHLNHNEQLEKQKEIEKKKRSFTYEVGDIVNIYGGVVYLGNFWYYKPNFNNEQLVNRLRKYKLYSTYDSDTGELGNQIYVESGKTQSNQPTEVLGHVSIDLEHMRTQAKERLDNVTKEGVGYRKGYYTPIPYENENESAYVLLNIYEENSTMEIPDIENLLHLGWFCGWYHQGSSKYVERDLDSRGKYPVLKLKQ